ncbi:MAG: hypothetical protein OXE93_03560 [bacterium]|nr:hypothetical protein [bacterium]
MVGFAAFATYPTMELIKAAIKTAVASFFSTLQHKLISRRTCSTITRA